MSTKRPSDEFFDKFNYLSDAKSNGVQNKEEFEDLVIKEGEIFSNLVAQGKRTEDDVESFECMIPIDYKGALESVRGANTAALLQREKYNQPVKGLKI